MIADKTITMKVCKMHNAVNKHVMIKNGKELNYISKILLSYCYNSRQWINNNTCLL